MCIRDSFTTAADNQTSVEIHVLQGERSVATGNKSIGKFLLDGILPAPRGIPQVEVAFDIDANGILNVSATDKATGKEQRVTIQTSSGLSDDDIDRMVKEAEQYADDDQKRKESIEVRNQADSAIYNAEKLISENGDKVTDDLKDNVQVAINDTRKALEGEEDTDLISQCLKTLNEALQALGAQVYATAGTDEGEAPQDAENDGKTVEGEYREL